MSQTAEFSIRFHKLQQAKEELAELALTKTRMEQAAALESMEQLRAKLQTAIHKRNQSASLREWEMWNHYVLRLEMEADAKQRVVEDLSGRLEVQRKNVLQEHRETKKWESLVKTFVQQRRMKEEKAQQKESDERAIIRYQRG
jgi:flagellar biosynthesis chaperone FliJ